MGITHRSIALASVAVSLFLAPLSPAADDSGKPLANQTISGLVRDIACPVQNKQSTARHFNRECALQCARQGSPLGILADDGTIYIPISNAMPDSDQRSRLMPFVGKYVRIKGDVYQRNGFHAVVITEIKEDPTVALQGDAS